VASQATAPDRAERSGAPGGPTEGKSKELAESTLARLFLSPSVAAMALIAGFPILYAAFLSFFAVTGGQIQGFVGPQNYLQAVTQSGLLVAVWTTAVFTVVSVSLEFLIGLGFALIMNKAFFGRGVTRATILIPWVIPTVVAAQMWGFMFNIEPGFINWLLPISENFNWLTRQPWALSAVIFADVWKTAPFVALLLLAGLQTIPGDVYESARVDGATPWQRFMQITMPLLKPAILVALLFRTVDALRVYDLAQVMGRCSPTAGLETMSCIVQRFAVQTPQIGLASAMSTLVFIIVLAVGIVFISRIGRDLVLGSERD
jgi:ABC-type sugar transport system permease subunit